MFGGYCPHLYRESETVGQKISVIEVAAAAGKASRIVRYGNYWENHVALLSQLLSFFFTLWNQLVRDCQSV